MNFKPDQLGIKQQKNMETREELKSWEATYT